jgi:hypothetical protein
LDTGEGDADDGAEGDAANVTAAMTPAATDTGKTDAKVRLILFIVEPRIVECAFVFIA